MKLKWLPRATVDRQAQIAYIARDNVRAAIEQGDRIAGQVAELIDNPKMGRPGRKPGTRELVIHRTPFIVIYRIKGGLIELLRLLHGAQQWPPPEK